MNILANLIRKQKKVFLLDYSSDKSIYKICNRRTLVIEETIHVTFDESNDVVTKNVCKDDNVNLQYDLEKLTIQDEENPLKGSTSQSVEE